MIDDYTLESLMDQTLTTTSDKFKVLVSMAF